MSHQPPIPFGRILRLGSTGRDCKGVGRALAHAGHGTLGAVLPTYGLIRVAHVHAFQKSKRLTPDGVYGPKTHAALTPFFDDYAFLLYTGRQPHPPPVSIALPAVFVPTHQTAGLPGYPAIDVFGPAGAVVLAPANGIIRRLSGRDPALGGVPGGAYGWSIYLGTTASDYFLTHLGTRDIIEGQHVNRGQRLGTICDARVAHMASALSHIHEGKKAL